MTARYHSLVVKSLLTALAAATLTACTSATLITGDQRRAVALAPFHRPAGLGQISIVEGAVFYPAQVNGSPAWCSGAPAYFALMEAKSVCVADAAGPAETEGWFKVAMVIQPAVVWRFDVDVPYRVVEGPALPPRR